MNVDLPKLKYLSCSAKSSCENFQYYGRGVFYGILIVLMMIIDVPKLKSDDIEFPSSVFQRLISIDSKSIWRILDKCVDAKGLEKYAKKNSSYLVTSDSL